MAYPLSVSATQSVNLNEKQLFTALVNHKTGSAAALATFMTALAAATTVSQIATAAAAFTSSLPAATITA